MEQKMNQPHPLDQHFIHVFHLLLGSARIHKDNNKALIHSAGQFVDCINRLCEEEDEVTLLFTEGGFYLQQEKIDFDRHSGAFSTAMLKFFGEREIEGLRFYDSINKAPVAEIAAFARLLEETVNHEEQQTWLEGEIERKRLTWVEHVQVAQITSSKEQEAARKKASGKQAPAAQKGVDRGSKDGGAGEGPGGPDAAQLQKEKERKNAIQTYGYAVLSLQDVAHKISTNKRASIKKTMRMVQNMIDMVVDDNNMFLSLSTIRDYDDYTFTHSINVAILSICLGNKIGLSKSTLETLSLCALFHDLGKIDIPKHILNKPGRLTDQELEVMKRHAIGSVRRIIRLKTTRKRKSSIMLPPFEHHLKYDLTGYPKTPRKSPVSLLGRIICITDVYDAITAPRVYRPLAWSPDRALGFMLEQSGTSFDPVLLKVFINMIGVYPVGTLLTLDNDELGLVAKYTGDDDQDQELWIQLLNPVSDTEFEKGELISLGSRDKQSGMFSREIIDSFNPSVFGIQPAEYIM